jgi:hypothetical protein
VIWRAVDQSLCSHAARIAAFGLVEAIGRAAVRAV